MFRLLIFLPVFLLGQELYLLPEESEILMDSYQKKILETHQKLTIMTPFLNEYELVKRIKELAKKGIDVSIITQGPMQEGNKAAHLALFENIHVCTLKRHLDETMHGSLISIDDTLYFVISDSLEQSRLTKGRALALEHQGSSEVLTSNLMQICEPY